MPKQYLTRPHSRTHHVSTILLKDRREKRPLPARTHGAFMMDYVRLRHVCARRRMYQGSRMQMMIRRTMCRSNRIQDLESLCRSALRSVLTLRHGCESVLLMHEVTAQPRRLRSHPRRIARFVMLFKTGIVDLPAEFQDPILIFDNI